MNRTTQDVFMIIALLAFFFWLTIWLHMLKNAA